MRFLLSLALVFAAISSSAADEVWVGLPDHATFKKLGREQKFLYMYGLQNLSVAINEMHSKQFRYSRKRRPASGDLKCEYAGHLLQLPTNGECPQPPQGTCSAGMIQCLDLLFGPGVCVSPGPNTTINCMENAKPINEIVAAVEKDRSRWDKISRELGEYCRDRDQEESCDLIRSQVYDINATVGIESAPPADELRPAMAGRSASRAPLTDEGSGTRGSVGPGPTERPGAARSDLYLRPNVDDAEIQNATAAATTLKGDSPAATESPNCQTVVLVETLKCDSKAEPQNVFSIAEAHRNFCVDRRVSTEEIAAARSRVTALSSCLRKTIASSSAYEKVRAKKDLDILERRIKPNFDSCVASLAKPAASEKSGEAKASATGAPPAPRVGARGELIQLSNGKVQLAVKDSKHGRLEAAAAMAAPTMNVEGVELCDLSLVGFKAPDAEAAASKKNQK